MALRYNRTMACYARHSNYFALELPEGSVSWMTIRKLHLILFKGVHRINHPCLWEILYC